MIADGKCLLFEKFLFFQLNNDIKCLLFLLISSFSGKLKQIAYFFCRYFG
jgi:hypothetical protein